MFQCDVLVASFDADMLRSAGLKLLTELWANGIKAELARNARSAEQLLEFYKEDRHSWLIIIKHDAHNLSKPDLKVKNLLKKEDTDLRSSEILSYLKAEIRERDHRDGVAHSTSRHQRPLSSALDPSAAGALVLSTSPGGGGNHHHHHPSSGGSSSGTNPAKANVVVLTNQTRSKKISKWAMIEAAQTRARELLAGFAAAPIAAIETRDDVMERVREARLSDPDAWRKVVQSVPAPDRKYLQDVHGMLERYQNEWKAMGMPGEGRMVFVYNFRTQGCFLYDLGL